MDRGKYRFVTRSDFDGLVSAVLMKHLDLINNIVFVHPKDMQDGRIPMSPNDITANLPYAPDVFMAFGHHISESSRTDNPPGFILSPHAASSARVIYEYYGGDKAFPPYFKEIVNAADKIDSAELDINDILDPNGWVLLGFITDPRTGLGRFHIFEISNYSLMIELTKHIGKIPVENILKNPHVKKRVDLYKESRNKAEEQIRRCGKMNGNVLVIDLRGEDVIWPTNRFMCYALFPEATVAIHLMWGKRQRNIYLATGKSILNRGCKCNIGNLLLQYQGGGLHAAAACQLTEDKADVVLAKIIRQINETG